MNWSLYLYLGPLCLLAAALLAVYVRLYDRLSAPSERRTRLEVTMLVATILLGIAVIYFNFFTGTSYFAYRDMGADTVDQYVPYYLDLVRKVGSGSLGTWNMSYGLGASFMSYQSWTLDPFCLVIVPLTLLLGQEHLSLVLVIAQGLKMLLCGLLFDHVLTFYCKRPLSRIVGSVLYSFCGFLLLWGQNYWIGASIVMATLMMLMLELLMQRWTMPRFWGLLAASAASIIMSTYSGYAAMLFSLSYALLRIPIATDAHGARAYLRQLFRLAVPVACGVLVSCVTLVPYAIAMVQESSRVVSSGQAPLSSRMGGYARGFVPLRWIPYLLSRLLGNGLVSAGVELPGGLVPASREFAQTNVYEMVQMGFSVGAVVLLCQFAWWEVTHADAREKMLTAVAGALCVLYCVNYFLPALSNVFSAVRYRSCFALAAPACIAMSLAFEHCLLEDRPSLPALVVSSVLTVAILAWSLLHTQNGRLACLYFSLAFVVFLVLCVARSRGAREALVVTLAAAVVLSTSVVDGFFVTNNRTWCTKDDFPNATSSYERDLRAALRYIRSQDSDEPATYRTSLAMDDLNASLAQGFMGVDSYNSTINSNLEEFYQRVWPRAIRGISAYQATRDDMLHPALQRILGVRYVACRYDLDLEGYDLIKTFGSVRVYKAEGTTSHATEYGGSVTEASAKDKTPAQLERLFGKGTAIVSKDAPGAYQNLEAGSSDTAAVPATKAQVDSQTSVSCDVTVTKKSICMVAIPYARGWTAKVDGKAVPTFRTNYGFIGVALKPGSHHVSLVYRPTGANVGVAMSAAGLVLALLAGVFTRHHDGISPEKKHSE